MGVFGFNNKRKSSLGGDFDGDGVKNRRDCEPLNWKKQGAGHDEETECECGRRYPKGKLCKPCIKKYMSEKYYQQQKKLGRVD